MSGNMVMKISATIAILSGCLSLIVPQALALTFLGLSVMVLVTIWD